MPRWPVIHRLAIIAAAAFWPAVVFAQSPAGEDWSSQVLDGVLQPDRVIEVATSEFGIVKDIFVRPGVEVRAGDLLAKIDSSDLESELAIATAEYEARGRLMQIEAEVKLQQQKVELLRKLHASKQANEQELLRAEADLEVLRSRLRGEEESIEVQRLQAKRLRCAVERCTIAAPVDGTVVEMCCDIGEYVSSSSPSILQIHVTSTLKATFPFSEVEREKLRAGDILRIRLADGREVSGVVSFIPPVADPESGWFMVTARVENADKSIHCSRCSRIP